MCWCIEANTLVPMASIGYNKLFIPNDYAYPSSIHVRFGCKNVERKSQSHVRDATLLRDVHMNKSCDNNLFLPTGMAL
jgi:hypothetical protein